MIELHEKSEGLRLQQIVNWKNYQSGWTNCDRNFCEIYKFVKSSECTGRGHSVKNKSAELFGENKRVGYGLEVPVDHFTYKYHKVLKLSGKPVFPLSTSFPLIIAPQRLLTFETLRWERIIGGRRLFQRRIIHTEFQNYNFLSPNNNK